MKKLNAIVIAAIAACSLQACHSAKNDSKAAADSVNETHAMTTDSSKMDTSSSAMASMTVDKDDAQFATKAASGGMAEVELGKIAQKNGSSQKVKDFGTMMVTDHSKANEELMALAKSKNITLPAAPGADEQKNIDDLSKKTGTDFDKAYASAMGKDHKTDISLFEGASKNAKDPDLKAFATKTLPTLKMHLQAAQAAEAAVKK